MRRLLLPALLLTLTACQAGNEAAAPPVAAPTEAAAVAAVPDAPAPAAEAHAHAHAGLMAHEPWSRPLAPGATVAAGYAVLMNHTDAANTLVSARADGVGRVEVHSMAEVDGVMQMRPIEGGLPVPAQGIAQLVPGGNHLMFFDVARTWAEGETVPVTLVFASGAEVVVEFAIRNEGPGGMADHGDHAHHEGHEGH
ncbi:MAG: copper chaperone PCu(A)C [Lysobacteraceae bacterium]